MQKPLIIKNTVAIQAPVSSVWDTLVNPEKTRKYMFGCEAITDWQMGSPLLWRGSFDGKEVVFVKGSIVAIEPGRFLSYSVFDPNSTMPDIPENYLTVTYELCTDAEQTVLTVTQGDFSLVAEGERRYNEVYSGGEGWNPILKEIKALAEKGINAEAPTFVVSGQQH